MDNSENFGVSPSDLEKDKEPHIEIEENLSIISSEGLTNDYIIDNLSPIWGIMLTVQDNLNLQIGTQLKKKYFIVRVKITSLVCITGVLCILQLIRNTHKVELEDCI